MENDELTDPKEMLAKSLRAITEGLHGEKLLHTLQIMYSVSSPIGQEVIIEYAGELFDSGDMPDTGNPNN